MINADAVSGKAVRVTANASARPMGVDVVAN